MRRRTPVRYSPASVTAADRHRFNLFRDGVSVAEIATRDQVKVAQVEKSILRCREERQQYSQEAVEVAVRRTVLEKLPEASKVISEAAKATKFEGVKVIVEDPETGKRAVMDDTLEVPDHAMRLRANSAVIDLLTAIKVGGPMVSVDARTQTQNVLGLPAHSGSSSAEAVIREIRAARGLALTDGQTVEGGNVEALIEKDEELALELEEDGPDDETEDDEDEEDLEPDEDEE